MLFLDMASLLEQNKMVSGTCSAATDLTMYSSPTPSIERIERSKERQGQNYTLTVLPKLTLLFSVKIYSTSPWSSWYYTENIGIPLNWWHYTNCIHMAKTMVTLERYIMLEGTRKTLWRYRILPYPWGFKACYIPSKVKDTFLQHISPILSVWFSHWILEVVYVILKNISSIRHTWSMLSDDLWDKQFRPKYRLLCKFPYHSSCMTQKIQSCSKVSIAGYHGCVKSLASPNKRGTVHTPIIWNMAKSSAAKNYSPFEK